LQQLQDNRHSAFKCEKIRNIKEVI